MSWLGDIIKRGLRIRALECGSGLPENPTISDYRKEAFQIAQLAKEVQNSKPGGVWQVDRWRKISRAIEKLEDRT